MEEPAPGRFTAIGVTESVTVVEGGRGGSGSGGSLRVSRPVPLRKLYTSTLKMARPWPQPAAPPASTAHPSATPSHLAFTPPPQSIHTHRPLVMPPWLDREFVWVQNPTPSP